MRRPFGLLRHLGWWLGLVPSGVAAGDSLILSRRCRPADERVAQDDGAARHVLERLGYLEPVAGEELS